MVEQNYNNEVLVGCDNSQNAVKRFFGKAAMLFEITVELAKLPFSSDIQTPNR